MGQTVENRASCLGYEEGFFKTCVSKKKKAACIDSSHSSHEDGFPQMVTSHKLTAHIDGMEKAVSVFDL